MREKERCKKEVKKIEALRKRLKNENCKRCGIIVRKEDKVTENGNPFHRDCFQEECFEKILQVSIKRRKGKSCGK